MSLGKFSGKDALGVAKANGHEAVVLQLEKHERQKHERHKKSKQKQKRGGSKRSKR